MHYNRHKIGGVCVHIQTKKKLDYMVKKGRKMMPILLGFIIVLSIYLYYQNTVIGTVSYDIELDYSFNNYKIMQIADLQATTFGNQQEKLVQKIKEEDPDIIVFTGDLFDRRRYYNKDYSYQLIDRLIALEFPLYYVSGNHECWSGDYDGIIKKLSSKGVHIMDNRYEIIEANGVDLAVMGLTDPAYYYLENKPEFRTYKGIISVNDHLRRLMSDTKGYDQVLLSHRPELIELYQAENVPLVLAGHAHGGQVRVPYVGGLYAPAQGFLPDYSEGLHEVGNTKLIISRGLGNSSFPFRVNNPPELVIINLK